MVTAGGPPAGTAPLVPPQAGADTARLRSELAAARSALSAFTALLAEYLAADCDERQAALWRTYARESYQQGRDDMAAELAAIWPAPGPPLRPLGPPLAEVEARRWAVRGEERTRETFGEPHPGDRGPASGAKYAQKRF